jgi:two-component system, NarL family, response regulator NreC
MTTIVLADDHKLILESIASLLNEVPGFDIVGKCSNGHELINTVERLRPDVAVVDIAMPELNGIDAVRRIRKISSATRLIALSLYSDKFSVREMVDSGVCAFVVKSGAATDLVEAIRVGSRGKVYLSREISESLGVLRQSAGGKRSFFPQAPRPLTAREREVLQMIGEGWTSKEIANRLKVSETTVKTHRNNLMDKLSVRDVAGLTRESIRLRLVLIE